MKAFVNLMAKLIFLLLLNISEVSAFQIAEVWNAEYSPELSIKCSPLDRFCLELCRSEQKCTVPLKVCKDCIGTSILMTNIFDRMGVGYRNTGRYIDQLELIEFIKEDHFVAFSSRSIYNQTDSFDSEPMRQRFQGLCPHKVEYPVVFFELKPKSLVLHEVKYVACGSEIFAMTSLPDVMDNLKPLGLHFPLF